MRVTAVATDYDGTLADGGHVSERTLAALRGARARGIALVLVTGRHLDDLLAILPEVDVFDLVVAENGAVLYVPHTRTERVLASAPPPAFAAALTARGVAPVACGRVVVATRTPHRSVVLETIRDLGLELEVVLNKDAVMVLPPGVDKASGLSEALLELGLDAANVVGVGDAENDEALLAACGLGVAVANAVPALRQRADLVTEASGGPGVVELLDRVLADGLPEGRGHRRRA